MMVITVNGLKNKRMTNHMDNQTTDDARAKALEDINKLYGQTFCNNTEADKAFADCLAKHSEVIREALSGSDAMQKEIEKLNRIAYHKSGISYQSMFICTLEHSEENMRMKEEIKVLRAVVRDFGAVCGGVDDWGDILPEVQMKHAATIAECEGE